MNVQDRQTILEKTRRSVEFMIVSNGQSRERNRLVNNNVIMPSLVRCKEASTCHACGPSFESSKRGSGTSCSNYDWRNHTHSLIRFQPFVTDRVCITIFLIYRGATTVQRSLCNNTQHLWSLSRGRPEMRRSPSCLMLT